MFFNGKILYYIRDFGAKKSFADYPIEIVTMMAVFLPAAAIFVLSSPHWEHTRKIKTKIRT